MIFNKAEAGRFRSNPYAQNLNSLRLVDTANPGTPLEDSANDIDVSAATLITGIRYAGKDGVATFYPFFNQNNTESRRDPKQIAAQADAQAIEDEIHNVIKSHEVDSIVKVTENAGVLTVTHIGSGTLSAVVVDGADAGTFSRGAISGLVSIAKTAGGDKPFTAEKAGKPKARRKASK